MQASDPLAYKVDRPRPFYETQGRGLPALPVLMSGGTLVHLLMKGLFTLTK
ncbi:hypothetical protein Vpro01_03472 [Vibrio proteolyticus]